MTFSSDLLDLLFKSALVRALLPSVAYASVARTVNGMRMPRNRVNMDRNARIVACLRVDFRMSQGVVAGLSQCGRPAIQRAVSSSSVNKRLVWRHASSNAKPGTASPPRRVIFSGIQPTGIPHASLNIANLHRKADVSVLDSLETTSEL